MDGNKPKFKMKTVVKAFRNCLDGLCRVDCIYRGTEDCETKLEWDALYYLEQTLEKSEKKNGK